MKDNRFPSSRGKGQRAFLFSKNDTVGGFWET